MNTELVTIPNGSWPLHGVLHRPAAEPVRRVGVLILQESHNTKFGTHRLFLQLGEALSETGFYALRYDNRGTCDSEGILDITFDDRLGDARSAVAHFRDACRLQSVVLWGLCMGAAVAVHLSRETGDEIAGLALCSILADPGDASLPEFGYRSPDLPHFLRDTIRRGHWLGKMRRMVKDFSHARKTLAQLAGIWARRYSSPHIELPRLRRAVHDVGRLLAAFDGPCLLIFGGSDRYLEHFQRNTNPGDRLGLARKRFPPRLEIIPGANHTFASREHVAELLRLTLGWIEPFRYGGRPALANPYPGVAHGVSLAPFAE